MQKSILLSKVTWKQQTGSAKKKYKYVTKGREGVDNLPIVLQRALILGVFVLNGTKIQGIKDKHVLWMDEWTDGW
jgi:hypothetical protein